ncbi:MAG: hypothetical protein Q8P30_01000 [Candidatus Uhrbacteria bacterium]|nr:hypothetical protein [Candidatus Uhrbacteria bacterium]
MRFSNFFMSLVGLFLTLGLTGCETEALGVCYEGGEVVFCGEYDEDGSGGYGSAEPDNSMTIEWAAYYSGYSDATVTCTFETNEGEMEQVAETFILDNGVFEFIFYDVPSHFDAECTGLIVYGSGPQLSLFTDENTQGETTYITWESEGVWDFWESNGRLEVNNG